MEIKVIIKIFFKFTIHLVVKGYYSQNTKKSYKKIRKKKDKK